MARTTNQWCPAHPHETARACLGCASDHKAGEHQDQASPSCRICREAAKKRQNRPRHQQPALTLDVAALAANDDTIADVIPLRPRRGRTHP